MYIWSLENMKDVCRYKLQIRNIGIVTLNHIHRYFGIGFIATLESDSSINTCSKCWDWTSWKPDRITHNLVERVFEEVIVRIKPDTNLPCWSWTKAPLVKLPLLVKYDPSTLSLNHPGGWTQLCFWCALLSYNIMIVIINQIP